MKHLGRPWLAPVVTAGLIAVSVAVPRLTAGGATGVLTPRSPAAIMAFAKAGMHRQFSGKLSWTAHLGFPTLPPSSGLIGELTSLASGTHAMRVWAGPDGEVRVSVVDPLSEFDVVRDGRNIWICDGATDQLTQVIADSPSPFTPAGPDGLTPLMPGDFSPPGIATATLMTVPTTAPGTTLSSRAGVTVAGRRAYDLWVSPRSPDSLIDHVDLAVDASTGTVLRTRVFVRGQGSAALDVGFTSVSFAAPGADTFALTARAPGRVLDLRALTGLLLSAGGHGFHHLRPTLVGSGWTAVIATQLHVWGHQGDLDQRFTKLGATPVQGAFGSGLLLRTTLLNVLITEDGLLFAGMVTPATLERIAGTAR